MMFEVKVLDSETNENVSYMFGDVYEAFEYFKMNVDKGLKCTLGTL